MNLKQVINERIARFDELKVIDAQKSHDIPLDVCDLIYSRKLLPVISPDEDVETPFGNNAPINGAQGMTITYAQCPPGTGPSLHDHKQTYETFTVLKGRFRFTLGAKAEEAVELGLYDTFSIPPAVHRAFTNVSDEEGILQVIITGGVHDMDDIAFPKSTADAIAAKGDKYLEYFKNAKMTFSATE